LQWLHAPQQFTFLDLVAHRSTSAGGCLLGAGDLDDSPSPPATLYKQTGRCEVTTTFIVIALFCCQNFSHSRSLIIVLKRSVAFDSASSQEEKLRENKKSQQQKFQENHNQMARVRSTARVDCEGDETETAETVPISEAMKRSRLVTSEDVPAAEAKQADAEETESEDDYSSAVPSKPSHLDFGKSTIFEGDLPKMLKLGYLSEQKKELVHFGGEETTLKPGKDEVVIFKSFFKNGLRFPLNEMIADVLKKFGIYLHQLTPNAIVRLSVYIWALRSQVVEPFAEGFCRVHELHYQTKARGDGLHENFGCYNFAYRKTTKFPVISYRSEWPAGWKSEWFYVKVDDDKEKLV
jgi:hypothetical protein